MEGRPAMEIAEFFERSLFDGDTEFLCSIVISPSSQNEIALRCDTLSLDIRGTGSSLLRSLDEVRRSLETRGLLLGCAGARLDVSITPLLETEWNGRRVHLMSTPRRSTLDPLDTLDIFDPTGRELLATIELQDAEGRAFARGKSKWSVRSGQ